MTANAPFRSTLRVLHEPQLHIDSQVTLTTANEATVLYTVKPCCPGNVQTVGPGASPQGNLPWSFMPRRKRDGIRLSCKQPLKKSISMQDLETLKRSIKSAEDLSNVVRTMKTMAAVSISQYEMAAKSLSTYSQTIETGLSMVLRNSENDSAPSEARKERTGAIVFGSDQGMCGQFNEQISEFVVDYLQTHSSNTAPVICIGHRIGDKMSCRGFTTDQTFRLPNSAVGITWLAQELLPAIDTWRDAHDIDRILVFHNRRITASSWQPFAMQLLPLQLDCLRDCNNSSHVGRSLPWWTMNTSVLLSRLVNQFLFVSLFRACAESLAGENASRITAMQSAERNINDRLHLLKGDYAQQRQTTITEELLDVVTGFEALQQIKKDHRVLR